jgi:glycosyltransferase involved in cell wall biosynthesis
MGCTPFWWQLFKGLSELGHELIVIPYLGDSIETMWWRTYPNPCATESKLFNFVSNKIHLKATGKGGSNLTLVNHYIKPKWETHLFRVLEEEQNVDALLIFNVPLNHIVGIPTKIKKQFKIPVIYFDGDLPDSLPEFANDRSFKFDCYTSAKLEEYDTILSCSLSAIEPLKKMGANNPKVLYYGVDTDIYSPIEVKQDIDIFYYGHRSVSKEFRLDYMIASPSMLRRFKFLVGGQNHMDNMGNVEFVGALPINQWRQYCCRSKINLNVTGQITAVNYGSSSMRPFELASMGCCIVSDAYRGIEEWFEVGKELFVAKTASEAVDIYKTLLSDNSLRIRTQQLARQRVIKDHSTKIRAKQLIGYVDELKKNNNRA